MHILIEIPSHGVKLEFDSVGLTMIFIAMVCDLGSC